MAVTKNLINIGDAQITGDITANTLIKRGGSGNQYLMADGTVSVLGPQGTTGAQGITGQRGPTGAQGPTGYRGATGPAGPGGSGGGGTRSYRFAPGAATINNGAGKTEIIPQTYCVADARVTPGSGSRYTDNVHLTITFEADFSSYIDWTDYVAGMTNPGWGETSTYLGFLSGTLVGNSITVTLPYKANKMEDNWYGTMQIRHNVNYPSLSKDVSQVILDLHGPIDEGTDYDALFIDGMNFQFTWQ